MNNSKKKQVGGSHYQLPIQPIEYVVKNNIPYREACVIKYVTRHRSKNGLEDIEKAIHYLEMIKEDYIEQEHNEEQRNATHMDEVFLEAGPTSREIFEALVDSSEEPPF